MSDYIVKLQYKNKDYYAEWSTIVDAPTTYFMRLEQFYNYYKDEYGNNGMNDLTQRLDRVQVTGCSAYDKTLDDLLAWNRAGKNGGCIHTQKGLYLKYKVPNR